MSTGPPQLMMAFTGDGQVLPELVAARDARYGVSTAGKRAARGWHLQSLIPGWISGGDAAGAGSRARCTRCQRREGMSSVLVQSAPLLGLGRPGCLLPWLQGALQLSHVHRCSGIGFFLHSCSWLRAGTADPAWGADLQAIIPCLGPLQKRARSGGRSWSGRPAPTRQPTTGRAAGHGRRPCSR